MQNAYLRTRREFCERRLGEDLDPQRRRDTERELRLIARAESDEIETRRTRGQWDRDGDTLVVSNTWSGAPPVVIRIGRGEVPKHIRVPWCSRGVEILDTNRDRLQWRAVFGTIVRFRHSAEMVYDMVTID